VAHAVSNCILAAFIAAGPILGAARNTQSGASTQGITYLMRFTSTPSGEQPSSVAAATTMNWSAQVMFAAGRGRMDIIDGELPGMFEKGDFVLFDAGDFIVVHPTTQRFSRSPYELLDSTAGRTLPTGMKMSLSNITIVLDTIGEEVVSGRRTSHYRIRTGYAAAIDVSGMAAQLSEVKPQGIETRQVTDYWYVDRTEIPLAPFAAAVPAKRRVVTGVMAELAAKMATTAASLPTGKFLVKTTTSTRTLVGPGMSFGSDNATEISEVRDADVDTQRLALPAAYLEAGLARGENSAAVETRNDLGAKWRAKPGAS
jgi:hypothetical protein